MFGKMMTQKVNSLLLLGTVLLLNRDAAPSGDLQHDSHAGNLFEQIVFLAASHQFSR
jgi:hypothetical protein